MRLPNLQAFYEILIAKYSSLLTWWSNFFLIELTPKFSGDIWSGDSLQNFIIPATNMVPEIISIATQSSDLNHITKHEQINEVCI